MADIVVYGTTPDGKSTYLRVLDIRPPRLGEWVLDISDLSASECGNDGQSNAIIVWPEEWMHGDTPEYPLGTGPWHRPGGFIA